MCEMCDKFKTCVACEYGGCEEHRAVEELAKPVNDSSVTAGTDRAVDAMKEVKNWFTDNYNDSTKVGIDPADDDGSNLDPNMYPNSDTTGGTTGGSQIRDNMFELLRDTIAAVPQKYWSRLGIGYTTMSGQSFPEACALHGADAPVSLGPQGEPLFRYSEDQPREPNGEFASGGGSNDPGKVIEHLNSENPVNPENDKERLVVVDGKTVGKFEVTEREGRLRIKGISSDTGNGNLVLGRITDAADKEGVTLELTASPYGSHKLDSDALKSWYGRHGFTMEQGYDEALGYMIREPNNDRSLSEPTELRFSEDQPRDPDGKFAGGEASGASAQSPEFEKQETKIEGDVKTTKYVSPNHSIIVEHNTKEGKVTVKHLDKNGDLLVQQTHDSIGAARKELQTQGIDHKFYAARSHLHVTLMRHFPIVGPQGEILLVRYSPDQARDPNGEFAHGSGETEKAAPQDKWKMAAGSREEFDRAVANTPGAKYTDKGLELDLSRYQPAEQAGAEAIRTGVFFLPELNSPYKSSYSTGKNGYGGGDKIEGRKEYLNPILTKGATGGKAPEKAYDMLKGKGAYEAMRSDVLNKVIVWNQSTSQKIDATREVLAKYGGKSDMASEIVQRSTQGNQLPYAIQEHIVACAVREAGHDAVISYSKSKGAERLSEVFDVNMSEYPSESFRSYLALLEFRFNADQPRDADGKFGSGGGVDKTEVKEHLKEWVRSSDIEGMKAAEAVKAGKPNIIVDAIRETEPLKGNAYRGMFCVKNASVEEKGFNALRWKEGESVQIMPCSFSTDENTAKAFATGENQGLHGDKDYVQVMLKVEPGMKGLRVDEYDVPIGGPVAADNPYQPISEHEVISGGRYSVVSVENVEKGYAIQVPSSPAQEGKIYNSLRVITLRQTGVF